MLIREVSEWNEKYVLDSCSAKSGDSKGREKPEKPDPLRTEFQKDRDRIIHSSSFRRLMHKTQVFLSPKSEFYRTRLTHTLEVSQIARTISKALRLNEDLTEAIALGHDLGHTPFGHNGERVLSYLISGIGGFKHSLQSERVCRKIERDGKGLNLTFEVCDGIVNHSDGEASTFEGKIVKLADKIAYVNHDIDDAVRAGVIKPAELPLESVAILGDTKGERIATLVTDIVNNFLVNGIIGYSEEIGAAFKELRDYMFLYVYFSYNLAEDRNKSEFIINTLYGYYLSKWKELFANGPYLKIAETESPERAVADYIAGMTDRFALEKFSEIVIPKFMA